MKGATLTLTSLSCLTLIASLGHNHAIAAPAQDKVTAAELKTLIEGLGYETKVLNSEEGKEKYEFTIKTADFNVPLGAEISPSKNYIWLTVFLGVSKPTHSFEELLKANGDIQPSFFYITKKGNLMMAVAIDNRQVTSAILKRNVDKISADVSSTSKTWTVK